jgi:hypothetical protein
MKSIICGLESEASGSDNDEHYLWPRVDEVRNVDSLLTTGSAVDWHYLRPRVHEARIIEASDKRLHGVKSVICEVGTWRLLIIGSVGEEPLPMPLVMDLARLKTNTYRSI